MDKKTILIFIGLAFALMIMANAIAATIIAPANLKVIEAPQRPNYAELPGFSEISIAISALGIAAYYLSRKKINKKGVSPIVATVLLIVLTIAMFVAVFAFSRSFISENVEKLGAPVQTACQSVSFSAVLQENVVLLTNTGNIVIYGFQVVGETSGTSKVTFLRTSVGKLATGEVDNLDIGSISANSKITLVPVLLGRGTNSGNGKLFPCKDYAKVIKDLSQ